MPKKYGFLYTHCPLLAVLGLQGIVSGRNGLQLEKVDQFFHCQVLPFFLGKMLKLIVLSAFMKITGSGNDILPLAVLFIYLCPYPKNFPPSGTVEISRTGVIIILFYYINTNEIPGELSCKNMISSHVKITFIFTREKITAAMVT